MVTSLSKTNISKSSRVLQDFYSQRDLNFSDIKFCSIFLKIYIFHPIKSEGQKWKCNQNDFFYCKFQETALRITVKFLG